MKRRTFIKAASGVAVLAAHGAVSEISGQTGALALEKSFQNPPADAGLSVVYHWTGGVATKEGITADMEGIAASGINTVNWFYFDGSGLSDGVQTWPCKSAEWWDLVERRPAASRDSGEDRRFHPRGTATIGTWRAGGRRHTTVAPGWPDRSGTACFRSQGGDSMIVQTISIH